MTFQKFSRLGTLLASKPVPPRLLLKESKLISTHKIKDKLNIFLFALRLPLQVREIDLIKGTVSIGHHDDKNVNISWE
jgi:hypothetical protein